MVDMGDNGFSNRHKISLTGYRILESLAALANKPAIAVGGEKIMKRHIREFLSESGFVVEDKRLGGELTTLGTAFYVTKDDATRSYSLTTRGQHQIAENLQGHPAIAATAQEPQTAP